MELNFSRSGGFAGPATVVEGKVAFEGKVAHVSSGLGYQRDLTSEEASGLRSAIERTPQNAQVPPGQLRDAYQYDIQIIGNGSQKQTVTVHGDSWPENAELLDWVRRECDRIWTYRINQ